jgi:hypothetical protein
MLDAVACCGLLTSIILARRVAWLSTFGMGPRRRSDAVSTAARRMLADRGERGVHSQSERAGRSCPGGTVQVRLRSTTSQVSPSAVPVTLRL